LEGKARNKKTENLNLVTNCVLDSGSNVTLLTKRAAEKMSLNGRVMPFSLTGIGSNLSDFEAEVVDIQITSADGSYTTLLTQVRIVDDIANSISVPNWNKYTAQYKYLADINIPNPVNSSKIDLLIGTDHAPLLLHREVREGLSSKDPVAIKTNLGWCAAGTINRKGDESTVILGVLESAKRKNEFAYNSSLRNRISEGNSFMDQVRYGKIPTLDKTKVEKYQKTGSFHQNRKPTKIVQHVTVLREEDKLILDKLTRLVEKHWETEDFPEDALTKEEEHAYEILRSTYRRNEEGMAEVSCLWKQGQPNISNNYPYAVMRINSLVDKMKDDIYLEIDDVFKAYVTAGTAKKIDDPEPNKGAKWYWPHFSVIKRDRESTPLRQVFDGKIAVINGKGINQTCFMAGPTLLNDLTQVLTRFSRFDVALIGDVSKFFPSIRMPEKDRPFHRFLWKDKEQNEIIIYEFCSHIFGNTGSPTCAIFAAMENARQHQEKYPRAAETIFKSTIIDDNCDSVHTEEEAIQLIKDLTLIYRHINLDIKKWASNRNSVVSSVPEEARTKYMVDFEKEFELPDPNDVSVTSGKEPCNMKILGLTWKCKEDIFTFKYQERENLHREFWTKHDILSESHKKYDPTGLTLPNFQDKCIMKETWGDGLGWKDKISLDQKVRWVDWLSSLSELQELAKKRVLIPGREENIKSVQIHAFGDASAIAYAACVYVRTVNTDGVFVNLALARGHITPRDNKKTIPKLELLSIELATKIASSLQLEKADIHVWSNSKTAIQWLNMDSKTYPSSQQ
jgi:hypothetical protein